MPDYEVRHPQAEATLNLIGGLLRRACPPGWGFAFLLFKFGAPGALDGLFYTSNAERQTMLAAMREFIARHEGN